MLFATDAADMLAMISIAAYFYFLRIDAISLFEIFCR